MMSLAYLSGAIMSNRYGYGPCVNAQWHGYYCPVHSVCYKDNVSAYATCDTAVTLQLTD